MIHHYKNIHPTIDDSAYIAKNATIIGDVTIGANSSVWFQTVIRGDVAPTIIGKDVSVQDMSVIHQSPNLPVIIEDGVTIGHQVTLHSCRIRENALIGMGTILLDDVEIGENAFIGAGSLASPGTVVPPNTLAFGRPLKVIRELTDKDFAEMERIRKGYVEKAAYYKQLPELN